MNPKNLTQRFKQVLTLVLTIAALAVGQSAWAQTFTIEASHNSSTHKTTFTITRSGSSLPQQTIKYRTVNLSAYAGQHYTAVNDTYTFPANETTKTVEVTESTPGTDAYKFQTSASRSYRFEVLDVNGFELKHYDRSYDTGTSVPSSGAFSEKEITIYTNELQYSDAGYDKNTNNPHYINSSSYYSLSGIAPAAYYTLIGAQLRSTLNLDAKELQNGYQYVQILINEINNCDNRSGKSDGHPGTPSLSRYMAGFDHEPGSANTNYAAYTFPVTSQPNDNTNTVDNAWNNGVTNKLYKQLFNTNCRATDGRLILPVNFEKFVVRFNASGGGDNDKWYAKNVKAHIQAVDATKPTLYNNSTSGITVSSGPYVKGNTFYISVPFSEIVTVTGTPTLTNNWGTLSYTSGSGSNVLTFKGTISNNIGNSLTVSGLSGTVKDLAGNSFTWPSSTTKTFSSAVSSAIYTLAATNTAFSALDGDYWVSDNNHLPQPHPSTVYFYKGIVNSTNQVTLAETTDYSLAWSNNTQAGTGTVNVNGAGSYTGTVSTTFPIRWSTYTVRFHDNDNIGIPVTGTMSDQAFTYNTAQNLTANAFSRTGYTFAGWNTAPDGSGTAYSDGESVNNLSPEDGATVVLYAQWTVIPLTGSGTSANESYVITYPSQLVKLADDVNSGNNYSGTYFKLGADIDMSGISFNGIGNSSTAFAGTFDGDKKIISHLTINSSESYKGLFGAVAGNVRNVFLDGASITCTGDYGGVIVGKVNSGSFFQNYYHNCTLSVGGNTATTNIAVGGGVGDGYNCHSVHKVIIGNNVTISCTFSMSVVIGADTYCVDGCEVKVGLSPTVNPGYSASFQYNDGTVHDVSYRGNPANYYFFSMPAVDNVEVSVTLTDEWGVTGTPAADGTQEHPYLITTTTGLDLLAKKVNGTYGYGVNNDNLFYKKFFKLGADITYSTEGLGTNESNYTAIGGQIEIDGCAYERYFMGTFDGDNKTVSGIRIYSSSPYQGLFGRVNDGTVKNVILANSVIKGQSEIGGIAGRVQYGTVSNCRVENGVTIYSADYRGGIVGYCNGTVSGCLSAASFYDNYSTGGGIAGRGTSTIKDCLFTGTGSLRGPIKDDVDPTGLTNNYYTSDGAYGSYEDLNGAHRARTITLGENLAFVGDQTTYSLSDLTAIGATVLSYNNGNATTIYSGETQTVSFTYTGSAAPEGYLLTVKYNDGSDHELTPTAGIYSFTMPAANVSVSASFTPITYSVHFDANGGNESMDDQSFTYDVAQNLTANAFTRFGYKFVGWTTNADGTGDSYTNAQNVSNLTAVDGATVTLYAHWVLCDWTVDNAGTESDPYMIYRSEQFDQLATSVNSGTTYSGKFFKLGDDITVSTMAGTSETKSFRGTFDGDNKTMTLALTTTSDNCAPFKYLKDATIKNLNIAGTISTSQKFAASIAAHTSGATNIQHCISTVEITSTKSSVSDGTHGGFVAVNDNGTLSFSNCVFAGKLLGANATCNGGFVGWNEKTEVNYTDCLFAPAEVTMSDANSATFNRNGKNTFTRTYYLTPFGEAQGIQAVSAVTANKVYKTITAADGNNYYYACDITGVDELYVYTGSAVTVTPVVKYDDTTLTVGTDYTVTIKDSNNDTVAPEDLINEGNYTLEVAGTGSCTGSQTFAFSIVSSMNLNGYVFKVGKDTEGLYYKIETTDDWNRLADYVNNGNNASGKRFMMTDDIAISTMVGTSKTNSFQGTFDGGNKTMTLDFTATSNDCAPFKYLKDATIKNLNIAGTISTSYQFAASIAAHTYSTTTIEHCTSTVEITSTVGTANSDGTHGGFVAVNNDGNLSFSNCKFAGKLLGANATSNGGFVGWNEQTSVTYTDCMFAPAEVTMGVANSATFNRNGKNTFTRTFFLTPFGEPQGTHITSAVPANSVYKCITAADGNDYYVICDITGVVESYFYTGSAVTVTPVVKCDNTTLTAGTDYTVTIKDSNNDTVAPEDLIDKGNYTLEFTGTGSYTGAQTFVFSISTRDNLNGYFFERRTDAEGIYYEIETTDDLDRLAAYVNSGNEAYGQRFVLAADIAYTHTTAWDDVNSTEDNYTAIGNADRAFCGTFDGQGYTISGIRINKPNEDFQGIFGRVYGGIVKNVTLSDARITGRQDVGGISGQFNGSSPLPTIENCLVLNATINGFNCGAVIGLDWHGTLTSNYYRNCTVGGKTTGVGCNGRDRNGARSVHTLTLGADISLSKASETKIIDNITYYASASTVTINYNGSASIGYAPVYSVNGTAFSGNTFTMPAADASVSATLTDVWDIADGADGSQAHPYVITTPAGLDLLAKNVNGTNGYTANGFKDTYFYLGADITYPHTTDWNDATSTENNFTAIGDYGHSFQGVFDGDGHTISGIRIYKGGSDNNVDGYQGLFGRTHNGSVWNVTLADARITGYQYVGGIIGLRDYGKVVNCHVTNTVAIHAVVNNSICHGGIVGWNICTSLSEMRNCTSAATISIADGLTGCNNYGGIVGQNNTGLIKNCLAIGTNVSGNSNMGAIIGYDDNGTYTSNYYHGCTVGGTTNATDVGSGSGDINGVCGVHSLTLTDGVTATATATVSYNSTNYYTAGTSVTLSHGSAPADYQEPLLGYILNGASIDGNTFTMPAGDAIVSARWTVVDYENGHAGTEADPYTIYNKEQLDMLATRVNTGSNYSLGKYFKLGADIEYDGTENNYTPIGIYSNGFRGTFDGDGHTISGINVNGSNDKQGLFGDINSGTVKNITLAYSTITGHIFVGGIVGYMYDGTVKNCRVESTVTIGADADYANSHGGIVGSTDGTATVSGCTSAATVTHSNKNNCLYYGGIVGNVGSSNATVRNCLAQSATIGGESGQRGAIVGYYYVQYFAKASLANNYYYNGTVGGATTNVGTRDGDITDGDGAVKVSAVLSETETVPNDLDGTVVLRREFTGGKPSTVCLPFEQPVGTEGTYYTFGGVAYDSNDGKWKATMTEYTGATLVANTPYLFVPAGSEAHAPVLFHGTAGYDASNLATTSSGWSFVGVYEAKTWAAADCGNDYGFAATNGVATDGVTEVKAGDFVKLAAGAWIRPMRSYLTYTGSGNPFAGARGSESNDNGMPNSISVILVSANGEVTEVNEVSGVIEVNDNSWFTLDGRKLDKQPTTKGLYIHNRKKVLLP